MPNRLRDFSDFVSGGLNNSRNKYLLNYNSNESKYELISPDSVLSQSASDGDIPDDFVSVVNTEVDSTRIFLTSFDGGSF